VFRRVWKTVETKAEKTGVAKAKGGKDKRRSRKKARRKEKGEKQKKQKREKAIEVKRVAEDWEIWDKEEEAAKLEAEVKKLVSEKFHR